MANEILIEEMVRMASQAPEPGTLGQVEHKIDGVPAMQTSIESAGYVYVYDTRTAERSVVNRNMLIKQLQKKREDGSSVFTTVKPNFEPKRGTLKCLLHKDNVNREQYNELGLATCRKSNLTSPYQVERHMTKRHKQEWETIKKIRDDEEKAQKREEEKLFRETMLAAVSGKKTEEKIGDITKEEFDALPVYQAEKKKK